MFLSNTRKYIC